MPNFGIANRAGPNFTAADLPPEIQRWAKDVEQWAKGLPLASIECKLGKVAAWSTIAGTGWTKVVFDTVLIDTGNFAGNIQATVTTDRIIVPPQAGGHFVINAMVYDDVEDHGLAYIALYTTDLKGVTRHLAIETWRGFYKTLNAHAYLLPGEYVSLEYYNSSGVAITIPALNPPLMFLDIARVAL